ncbi:MAG: pitrilysin family protein [Pseudomonadota bacterium]
MSNAPRSRWLARLAALALALTVTSNVSAADIDIPYEKFVLDNGLRVIVHEDRKAPIVAVSIWYHVGSKDEPEGKSGFAHLFEHLMFNGSENYDDEFFRPLEDVGATQLNGTTYFDRTNYFETVPTPALELALFLESDRMGHLLGAISQDKLDEQRDVVKNEKRQGDNQPYGLVNYKMLEGIFPEGHPYRWSPIGSMEDLNNASVDDVKEWFSTRYGPNNAVLVLAGDVDAATAKALVDKYFGDIPPGPPLHRRREWVPRLDANVYETMQDRVPQTRIYRSWPAPATNNPQVQRLDLAAAALGSGKNSRLYKALVYDKQLATSVSASMSELEIAGNFDIEVTLNPDADLDQAIDILDTTIAAFLESGPTNDEIERARTSIEAGVVRGLEQVGGFGGKATTLARGELYAGNPADYAVRLARLNQATPKEVKAIANDWLTRGYYQLVVSPYGEPSAASAGVDRSSLPELTGEANLSFPTIERATLSNGIEVALAKRSTVPVVNVAIQFDAGYAADVGQKLGTSSFALAMLDEGTADRTALEISATAERLGASISAGSNLDVSTASLSALVEKLDPSLELFADVVREPLFAEAEIERLRRRWLATIGQEKVQPVGLALRALPPLLYGEGHAYAIPFTGSGTEASITSLTREDLQEFHRRWIRPSNATIYVAGDTDLDSIVPMLEKHFGKWKDTIDSPPEKVVAEVPDQEGSRVFLINRPAAPQTLILAGHLAPPKGDPANMAIETMNDALGGQFTARINMNLREDKGWAYGAYSILYDARGQRPWLLYAPVQSDRTGDAIAEMQREVAQYTGERPATDDEVARVVNNAVRSLPGQFETAGAVLGAMLSNARYGRPDEYVRTLVPRYKALETEAVNEQAQRVLADKPITWVIVGDLSAIREQVEALELGPIEVLEVADL